MVKRAIPGVLAASVAVAVAVACGCGSDDLTGGAGGGAGASGAASGGTAGGGTAGTTGGGAGEPSGGTAGAGATGGSGGTASGGAAGAGGGAAGAGATGGASGAAGGGGAGGSGGSATGGAGGSGGAATGGASGSGGSGATGGGAGTGGAAGSGGSTNQVVRIVAIGDTGEGNPDQHLVADRMSEKCGAVGGCDAVLLLGDNFYDHGVQSTADSQWGPKFEQVYDRPNLNGLKFYATLGNHDYGLTSQGNRQAQIDYTQLPVGTGPGTRPSDKWVMYDAYYDVRIGPVHFFCIDSQDYGATQKNDMRSRVTASDATWKIVFGHHPRFTSGDHGVFWDNPILGAAGMFSLIDTISCGADMYLSGHDHNMEFIDRGMNPACPNQWFAISGAGAKVRSSAASTVPKQLFYDESIEGLAYLEFSGNQLRWQFIDSSGKVLWEKTLTK